MRRLENYFIITDIDDEYVYIKNGAGETGRLPYTITLNPDIPDDMCHRVKIHNTYFYF